MDLNYRTNLLFPAIVHQFDVNGFGEVRDKLIDYAYDLKKKEPEGVSISNNGGWQSSDFSINDENDTLWTTIAYIIFVYEVLSHYIYSIVLLYTIGGRRRRRKTTTTTKKANKH